MSNFSEFIYAIAGSPVVYLVLAALLIVDGFFPLVPGETTVVALATLGAAGRGPEVWIVLVVAIFATMIGDGISFSFGRRVGLGRWKWLRRPRVARAVAWASSAVIRRPASTLICAKFLPFVRVVVSMTAGAGGLAVARYLPISFAASTIYTGYHVVIAVAAGSMFAANPLLGVIVSFATLVLVTLLIEGARALSRNRRLRVR